MSSRINLTAQSLWLYIYWFGIHFHFSVSSFISFNVVFIIMSFTSFLKFTPRYFIYYGVITNRFLKCFLYFNTLFPYSNATDFVYWLCVLSLYGIPFLNFYLSFCRVMDSVLLSYHVNRNSFTIFPF